MRHSAFASKPPQASTTALARTSWRAAPAAHAHAVDAVVVGDKVARAGLVGHLDAVAPGRLEQRLDQARAAAPGLDREPAPELEAALDLERLAPPDRRKAHALVAHPAHGGVAAPHQQVDQLRVGAILGHPRHVVEELVLGVGAEIGARDLVVGEVRHQGAQMIDAVIGDAEGAGGEVRVAAALLLRRALQHQDRGALVGGGERRAHARHCPPRPRRRRHFPAACMSSAALAW